MILFDAHVHLPKDDVIDELLNCARSNFSRQAQKACPGEPAAFFLFLAEMKGLEMFTNLHEQAGSVHRTSSGWLMAQTQERESLLLTRDDWPDGRLFLIAGRQLVTAERIEVLALATSAKIADGLPLAETVESVQRQDGLPVLPWGVGKWLGKRGELVEAFVKHAAPDNLFVGDNGGRPSFWPAPRVFDTAGSRGIRLLPGSDSLPLPKEESRVGSYGGLLRGQWTADHPAAAFKQALADRSHPIVPFGRRLGAWRFFMAQAALRRLKRIRQ